MTGQSQEVRDSQIRVESGQDRAKRKKPESSYRRLRYELSKTWARTPLLRLRHRGFRETDVFFAAYPRSGSTWSTFTLFEILTHQEASFDAVHTVFRGVGTHSVGSPILPGGGRLIGTHESYRAEYKKAVYLVRDARDVLLSEYAYLKALGRFRGELEEFVGAFVRGKVNGFGAWQLHVASWLNSPIAGTSSMLLVRFEDLRSNPEMVFRGIGEFLGMEVEAETVKKAIANNSLEQMRAKEDRSPQRVSARGRFVRSGSTQKWRTELSPRQLQMVEQAAGDSLRRIGYPIGSLSRENLFGANAQTHISSWQNS
jgi:Sulfotransferase domain